MSVPPSADGSPERRAAALRDLLTIAIPTRNRPDLLALCLASVFDRQTVTPRVVVSDNSTRACAEIESLQRRYQFDYKRRSGALTITEHFNTCIREVKTPWVLLLHDDDELYPGSLETLERLLPQCGDVGGVIGAVEYIDDNSNVMSQWTPTRTGVRKGEAGLLELGMDFHGIPPSTVLRVADTLRVGGYQDSGGIPADYTLNLTLAYSVGVFLTQEVLGRYRRGHIQETALSDPQRVERWLGLRADMVLRLRSTGCSNRSLQRLLDFAVWSYLWELAPSWWRSNKPFVFALQRRCLQLSPAPGAFQHQVRRAYPFLFWSPRACAWPLFRAVRKLSSLAGTLTGDWYRIDCTP